MEANACIACFDEGCGVGINARSRTQTAPNTTTRSREVKGSQEAMELQPLYLAVHEAFAAEDYAAAVRACDQSEDKCTWETERAGCCLRVLWID